MAKGKKKTVTTKQTTSVAAPAETRTRHVVDESRNNKVQVGWIVAIIAVLLGLYLLLAAFSGQNQDDIGTSDKNGTAEVEEPDKEAEDESVQPAQSDGTTLNETDAEYSFTVGEGESYTTIARQAVFRLDAGLTPAERVAAETKLTTDNDAQWLNTGQNLVLTKDAVQAAVDWAKSLSAEQKAAWQPYADLVAWQ